MAMAQEPRCTVDSGPFVFHYLVEQNVCYLCLCDKTYPRRLAFSYLEELQKEFQDSFANEIMNAARPYALVKFDTSIQKIKKQYKNTQTQRNIAKLNEDLHDVTRIMTRNIQDVLGRQEALNRMSEMSSQLVSDSNKYLKGTKYLNWQAMYRKYGPPTFVILVVLIVLYWRFW